MLLICSVTPIRSACSIRTLRSVRDNGVAVLGSQEMHNCTAREGEGGEDDQVFSSWSILADQPTCRARPLRS
ncbi:hypothetical protein MRB53_038028 [Persea americana]|nr:hypothetical protein MRB53_038028 [Persea americana]